MENCFKARNRGKRETEKNEEIYRVHVKDTISTPLNHNNVDIFVSNSFLSDLYICDIKPCKFSLRKKRPKLNSIV